MSELPGSRQRPRRADARRAAAAVLDAAVEVLGRDPQASVEDIAAAAGVARQTVYAHYPTRQVLLDAVVEHLTEQVAAALNAVNLTDDPAPVALARWLHAAWDLLERYPVLLSPAMVAGGGDAQDELGRHDPVTGRLRALIRRGRRDGVFDRRVPVTWLVSATIALGHAAAQEVAAERMTSGQGRRAFTAGVLRVFAAPTGPAG